MPQFFKKSPTHCIRVANPNDVVLGRGSKLSEREGNKLFRELARDQTERYSKAKGKYEKDSVARDVLNHYQEASGGGRFLRPVTAETSDGQSVEVFECVETSIVMAKTKQRLRDFVAAMLNEKERTALPEFPGTLNTNASSVSLNNNAGSFLGDTTKSSTNPMLMGNRNPSVSMDSFFSAPHGTSNMIPPQSMQQPPSMNLLPSSLNMPPPQSQSLNAALMQQQGLHQAPMLNVPPLQQQPTSSMNHNNSQMPGMNTELFHQSQSLNSLLNHHQYQQQQLVGNDAMNAPMNGGNLLSPNPMVGGGGSMNDTTTTSNELTTTMMMSPQQSYNNGSSMMAPAPSVDITKPHSMGYAVDDKPIGWQHQQQQQQQQPDSIQNMALWQELSQMQKSNGTRFMQPALFSGAPNSVTPEVESSSYTDLRSKNHNFFGVPPPPTTTTNVYSARSG